MLDIKNFAMPAEWDRHERTLSAWPVRASMIHPDNFDVTCQAYADVVRAIAEFEPVSVIVDEDTAALAQQLCGGGNVEYMTIPHNDAWIRDNGPTMLLNKKRQLVGVNWRFNAWGEKYPDFELDNLVAPAVLKQLAMPCFDSTIVLEGGSIHVDGAGTLLTTEECLLHQSRNKHLNRADIEAELKRTLNVTSIVWLKRGLHGDETDGHVDNLACFARPGVILMQACDDDDDPNCGIAAENLEILQNATDANGRRFEIVTIPQPPARYYRDTRLTLSYLNFYFVNGGIILPVFGGDAADVDETVVSILQGVFPERKIRTVDGVPLVREGGNVHCITQQVPEGLRIRRKYEFVTINEVFE